MQRTIKILWLQIFLLVSGTVFAWYTTLKNFFRFYNVEGTIFKIQDCAIPNPVTEPCFYGAIGFLLALVGAIVVYKKLGQGKLRLQHYLWWFISAGTIFAWFNAGREIAKFYTTPKVLGCSGIVITNPFTTPCFIGASIFLLAAIAAWWAYSQLSKAPANAN